jgi:hypothetical protein
MARRSMHPNACALLRCAPLLRLLRRIPFCGKKAAIGKFLATYARTGRKARDADGRSGAAGRRGGTVRFGSTGLGTNRLGGPNRVNEERGSIAWHVTPYAGEPKARASTELPEAQRLPSGARGAGSRGNGVFRGIENRAAADSDERRSDKFLRVIAIFLLT